MFSYLILKTKQKNIQSICFSCWHWKVLLSYFLNSFLRKFLIFFFWLFANRSKNSRPSSHDMHRGLSLFLLGVWILEEQAETLLEIENKWYFSSFFHESFRITANMAQVKKFFLSLLFWFHPLSKFAFFEGCPLIRSMPDRS